MTIRKGTAVLIENKALVQEKTFKDYLYSKGFGEKKEKELVLDLFEVYYLTEKEKLLVKDLKGKKLTREKILAECMKKNKHFYSAFQIYADLKQKGFVIKTGFKFGFSFRVYPKGKKMGEAHTEFVVMLASQEKTLSMPQLSRAVRLASTLNTNLLIAVIDSENDINYYEVSRKVL